MLIVTTVFAITTALAAFSVGLVCGYYRADESSGFKAQSDKLRSDAEGRAAELEHATTMLRAAQEENANLTKRVTALTRHYLDQTNRMRAAEQQRIDAEARVAELESEVSVLKERGRFLAAKVAEQNTFALGIQKELTSEIENDPIRGHASAKLKTSSEEKAATINSEAASRTVA